MWKIPPNRHILVRVRIVCGDWLCQWEMAIFDPTESTSLNRSPKYLSQVITSATLYDCAKLGAYPSMGEREGLLGTWVKYNQNYFCLYPFFGTHLQVRPVDVFSRMTAQTTRTRARMCLWGGIFHIAPHLWGENPQFLGMSKRYQAKIAKSKNVHIIKTTASIPTKFCTVVKTTKCPSWVVPKHALQSKMADGRHLGKIEKLLNLIRGLCDFDKIWHADAVRTSWLFRPLKICNFENPSTRYNKKMLPFIRSLLHNAWLFQQIFLDARTAATQWHHYNPLLWQSLADTSEYFYNKQLLY